MCLGVVFREPGEDHVALLSGLAPNDLAADTRVLLVPRCPVPSIQVGSRTRKSGDATRQACGFDADRSRRPPGCCGDEKASRCRDPTEPTGAAREARWLSCRDAFGSAERERLGGASDESIMSGGRLHRGHGPAGA